MFYLICQMNVSLSFLPGQYCILTLSDSLWFQTLCVCTPQSVTLSLLLWQSVIPWLCMWIKRKRQQVTFLIKIVQAHVFVVLLISMMFACLGLDFHLPCLNTLDTQPISHWIYHQCLGSRRIENAEVKNVLESTQGKLTKGLWPGSTLYNNH